MAKGAPVAPEGAAEAKPPDDSAAQGGATEAKAAVAAPAAAGAPADGTDVAAGEAKEGETKEGDDAKAGEEAKEGDAAAADGAAAAPAKVSRFAKKVEEFPGMPKTSNPLTILYRRALKKRQQIIDSMYHYGPPYHADYGGDLPMECNVAKPSSMTIHALLNDGADPNIGDENDYSNCPLHYCARYCSTKIANMLLEASCKMNKENELGVTPLSMLCMFNQPEPRQKKYLEFVVWMLDNGSDINHVDKGGHTPLDIAASNGNMKLVSLLLQRGARVRREVEFLSIKVPSAVDTAANDDIRHLIERQLGLENDAEAVRKQEALRARLLALAEEEMAGKASNNKVWYTRQNREDAQRQKQSYEHTKRLEGEKRKLRIAEKAARLSMLSKKEASFGVWEKNKEVKMEWVFRKGVKQEAAALVSITAEAQGLANDIKNSARSGVLRQRWLAMTGLELVDPGDDGTVKLQYEIDAEQAAAVEAGLGFDIKD